MRRTQTELAQDRTTHAVRFLTNPENCAHLILSDTEADLLRDLLDRQARRADQRNRFLATEARASRGT